MPRLYVPAALQQLCGGVESVAVTATTVGQAVEEVERMHPGVRSQLCEGARLKPGVMLSIDGRLATLGMREPVSADSEIHFLPAIGGG
ncbi:MAG: hypothetical protein B7Z55_03915 [Planctomycetales bacterium 12-60-4]|nr:MAG: hypothetical protein B7Z55_03915 [Planctomycetales bacterium 12-60-4]